MIRIIRRLGRNGRSHRHGDRHGQRTPHDGRHHAGDRHSLAGIAGARRGARAAGRHGIDGDKA